MEITWQSIAEKATENDNKFLLNFSIFFKSASIHHNPCFVICKVEEKTPFLDSKKK
jgi:hypothetical protein